MKRLACAAFVFGAAATGAYGQGNAQTHITTLGDGYAQSSVNTVMFRTSSVVSSGNVQFTAYYDADAHVVLARRMLGSSEWQVNRTDYTNTVTDAHNAISLGVDGKGILHVAWAEHNKGLHYARSVSAGSLVLGPAVAMTGQHEARVTYPQFFTGLNGDLLFLYRDGSSGNGDVMLNRWSVERQEWRVVAHPLIAGEGARNAYVNGLAIDARGGWHVSWVWRDSPDVASNHDLMYAYSADEGHAWQTSTGRKYVLPITAMNAEIAWPVPKAHELINQTSMTVDDAGHPMIATYWRDEGSDVPQFRLVWNDGAKWNTSHVGIRARPFRLSGGGTKRIPVSRPLVVAGKGSAVYMIYRDEERGTGITAAVSTDREHTDWRFTQILDADVGLWEPTYDPVAWKAGRRLYLFVQRVGQGDGETLEAVSPQPVRVLEWQPSP